MPKIIILDGNSLANRAFYALPPLTTPDGRPTNVLHGFMTMLLRLLQEQKPDYWVVAFDKSKATVRIEQYAEYKAHRKETPDGLKPQFDYLKEVLAGFDVPILEFAGYEADDLIATVTKKAENKGWEVQIYTGDRDALQLITPKTRVFLTKKGISEVECYDEHLLWERYKLRPEQIIDLKGLMGDSSDNIPGVPGVGEKTALKLLWEFGSVEAVLENTSAVAGKKLQATLIEYKEQALLSKRLATMFTEVPVEYSIDDLAVKRPAEAAVSEVLQKYSLRNIARIWQEHHQGGLAKESESVAEVSKSVESDSEKLIPYQEHYPNDDDWLNKLKEWETQGATLIVSYKYSGANPHWGTIEGWAAVKDEQVFHLDPNSVSAEVLGNWHDLLENPNVFKVIADSKTLTSLLRNHGKNIRGMSFDLALAAYLLNSSRTKFAPVDLVREYIPECQPFNSLTEEAAALAQVYPRYQQDIEKYELSSLLHSLEEPLSNVLAQMEAHGIGIDIPLLKEFGQELESSLQTLESEIHSLAAESFNINSPQQLGRILFEKLGLPPVKKTKTGYSTDAETLEELRQEHPIIEKILDYRQLNKLVSTYVNGLVAQERKGRIHTTFQQTVTTTGRLSSTEPNLQNIPIRLEQGRLLRKVFRATEPDWLLISADYSQIELRILAHYSEDPLLCESFALGQDVHSRTAAEVFGVPIQEVTSEMRRRAKAVNFGLIYGLTDFGLSRDLGIPRKEAKYYIEQYFLRYQGVKRYMQEVVAKAKETAQVRTLLKRLRRVPELHSSNRTQRQFGERIAMNTPIQGTAADIMKLAMLDVEEALRELRSKMLLQVHDELLIQVPTEEIDEVAVLLKDQMENAFPLIVPLTVECKVGPNWYDMKQYDFTDNAYDL
ncbi:MAG: DNA polymerase I [Desulfitobacterium hafniense]|nr:DNA polymerase I [Desulfitobacterium hafniense]